MAETIYISNDETFGSATGTTYFDYDQIIHVGSADAEHAGTGTAVQVRTKGGDQLFVHSGGLVLSSYLAGAWSPEVSSGLCSTSRASAVIYDGGLLSSNTLAYNFSAIVENGGKMLDTFMTGTNAVVISNGGQFSGVTGEQRRAVMHLGNTASECGVVLHLGNIVQQKKI